MTPIRSLRKYGTLLKVKRFVCRSCRQLGKLSGLPRAPQSNIRGTSMSPQPNTGTEPPNKCRPT